MLKSSLGVDKKTCIFFCPHKIRRPRPLPRQGRRLGPPEVWNLALGSQAKAHAIKATPLSATCPRHLPCSCRTLTPTCPRTFKTAVCPASNPPNASAGLRGNNSYSYYMPLPSVFQGVQDCRLPALKPPKRFQRSRRPPRQQLLQLHAPAICFSGGSRLPFARPQTPQTLPTLPQASKATTLTATLCQLHAPDIYHAPAELLHLHAPGRSRLPFARPQTLQTLPQASKATTLTCPRTFKTAVCPPSNPPNASAGLQGNNSYSYYMPLPSVFQGVQDCRLPALKPPKRFQRSRRPPRQQLLQLPSVSYMPQTSTMLLPNSYTYMPQDVQDCRLPGLKPSKRFRRPPRQQLLQLHAPAICFSGGSRLPFARPQTPQTLPTLPQASKATTLTATCPCRLFFRGFKTAVCPPSNPPNASNAPAGLQGNNSYSYMSPNPPNASNPLAGLPGPAICFSGVQDCRLPALKPPKRFQRSRRPPRQQLLQLHAPAICFSGGSRLPFARPQTPQTLPTLPQASKATTLTATLCQLHAPDIYHAPAELLHLHAPGRSRLPFARPQTLQTLPQASKATTLTATTCPCHLFFRGFKTAVCPPSNPPNASNAPAGLQGNNSYSYMPLPSVFQGVQDCRLPALKPPKRFQRSRRPPRQQLLQLHVPKPSKRFQPSRRPPRPCHLFFRGSRLPFARPQTPQTLPTLPQASKATTLTATCPQTLQTLPTLSQASKATTLTATCPCHLFFRGFKTAVCPPSNPPNASNALAGLQGNNSYSYMSNAPAGLRGNNSYSYMPLPSVFQGVQDCRLPGPKPPKRFQPSRRPPRQQLLQLHAPAICFSGGSRLPFACPQTPQTLPTLPQASKATTLTATCPCHLFFRGFKTAVASTATCPCHLFFTGFKTAVCPASNPPNASSPPAGLQGNNSYSYMPLPSVFQGVQDCRLPALKPPKRFQRSRRPPRQQLLQLHVPAICFSGVQDCRRKQRHTQRLPGLKPSKRFRTPPRQQLLQLLHAPAICFSGGSRLPFARPQTPQTLPTLPQASKATTLTATCPCHLFFTGFKTAVYPPSNPPNASNAPAGLQGNNSYSYPLSATCPRHLPCSCRTLTPTCPRTFKTAVCPASNPPNASAGLQGNNSYMPQDVQDCRLPGLKPSKRFRRPPRQQLLQLLHAPAICFSGGSRLPFARPQTPQTLPTLPQASKATTLTATCPCHLFFRGFKTAVCPPSNPPNASNAPAGLQGNNSYSYPLSATCPRHLPCSCRTLTPTCPRTFKTAVCPASNPPNASAGLQGNNSYSYYMPLPSVFQGVQDCRLPALKPPKRFQRSRRPPRQQLLQLHAPAICFSGGSRLPFARPQTPQTLPTLPQASKATTLTATCPCHLFFRGFKTAVCPPSNPPNASNAPAGLQGNNSYSYPLSATCPRHLPCSCRTLTPTCPRTFKTAVCPASNPPNASAGLQGNNSYSYYMPLPSVFQGVQDCRLPALKPPKRFQRSRRPPRQQLLQLHAPAICFSGGSRLPFARPQTPQTLPTLPQASKATTLTATCPQTLQTLPTLSQASQALPSVFQGFKTAVCPPSNPPNASNAPAGLQGNNSYSYMPLPSVFQGVQDCRLPALKPPKRFQRSRRPPRQQLLQLHAPAICFSGGSRLPFARPQTPKRFQRSRRPPRQQLLQLPSVSYMPQTSTMLLPNSYTYMPQDVQDCRLPGLKPSKRFRRPPRQQLLQLLHAPAICFSGGSRLPFARPQTPQTLPTLPQASKATTLTATCPCHLFFRGFKTAVCPPSNPPNASNAPAGLQGNNSYSYMSPNPPNASNPLAGLPGPAICFSGVQDCRLPALKPPKRFQRSRRPPRQQLLQLHVLKPGPDRCLFSSGKALRLLRPNCCVGSACEPCITVSRMCV